MTITETENRIAYVGNGVTAAFPFPYPFAAATDLVVVETVIATGVETVKALTTHYTISGVQDDLDRYPNGGTINAVLFPSSVPASTVTWTIYRDPPETQGADLVENDNLPAETVEATFDYVTMLIQRLSEVTRRSLRQPEGDSAEMATLPGLLTRASKYLAFDASGNPTAQDPSTAGGTTVIATGGTVDRLLADMAGDWIALESLGPVGTSDDSATFQAAADLGGNITVNARTYTLFTVSIVNDVTFWCEEGTVFKRKANADVASGSYNTASSGMFNFTGEATLTFQGSLTYDGNNANQTSVEPTGFFVRMYSVGGECTLNIWNGYFINGTSGYLLIKGDGAARAYRSLVYLHDCRFFETKIGIGQGDPSTPNPLGYTPQYVLLWNYVECYTNNFHAEWNTALGVGEYAASGIWCSYNGVQADGGVFLYMHGTTYLKGMGRSGKLYDGSLPYGNNGLGAVDMYGNAELLFVENVVAFNAEVASIRAKCSLKYLTVLSATFTDCIWGIQCGPSTTGVAETKVYLGSVTSINGSYPIVEVVGTTDTDLIQSCRVDYISCTGTIADVTDRGTTSPTDGVAHFENTKYVSVGLVHIENAPKTSMDFDSCETVTFEQLVSKGSLGNSGSLIFNDVDLASVHNFDIQDGAAQGIYIINGASGARITLRDGYINNCVNYGVFGNDATSDILCDNVRLGTISGLDRGFYKGAGGKLILRNCEAPTVGTPVLEAAGADIIIQNPRRISADKGNAAATLVGFSSESTQIWNTAISADRAVTLPTTRLGSGHTFRIVRTAAATGAFNLNVGTGPLKALVPGTWCDVQFNGTVWFLVGYGAL